MNLNAQKSVHQTAKPRNLTRKSDIIKFKHYLTLNENKLPKTNVPFFIRDKHTHDNQNVV